MRFLAEISVKFRTTIVSMICVSRSSEAAGYFRTILGRNKRQIAVYYHRRIFGSRLFKKTDTFTRSSVKCVSKRRLLLRV